MSKEINIPEIIESKRDQYPVAAATVERFFNESIVLLRKQMEFSLRERGDYFWPLAEKILTIDQNLGGDPIKALLEYTLAFLREQASFMKTGNYRYDTDSFNDAFAEVYDNPDVMENFYLEGLLVTHVFWPIHLDMHRFFEDHFLSAITTEKSIGAEFGFGHGLYLYEILKKFPDTYALGFDISKYSLSYAQRLLEKNGIAKDRFSLDLGDVRQPLALESNSLDWCVFAEVLEHIPNPKEALTEISRCLNPNGHVFITTAINSNALDHLWHFNNMDEVTDMLSSANLQIVSSVELPLSNYDSKTKDPTIDCAFVCTPTK